MKQSISLVLACVFCINARAGDIAPDSQALLELCYQQTKIYFAKSDEQTEFLQSAETSYQVSAEKQSCKVDPWSQVLCFNAYVKRYVDQEPLSLYNHFIWRDALLKFNMKQTDLVSERLKKFPTLRYQVVARFLLKSFDDDVDIMLRLNPDGGMFGLRRSICSKQDAKIREFAASERETTLQNFSKLRALTLHGFSEMLPNLTHDINTGLLDDPVLLSLQNGILSKTSRLKDIELSLRNPEN